MIFILMSAADGCDMERIMRLRNVFCILVLVMLLTSSLALPFPQVVLAQETLPVHNIRITRDYATINEALEDSDTVDGDSITVDAGTYSELIVINKSVSLVGRQPPSTIIDGAENGTVIQVLKSNVNVTGFT